MGVHDTDPLSQLSLPPGFRFFPTDEELLVKYLCRKVAGYQFSLQIIAEIDLYKFDPWVLPDKAMFGEREWYFFSPRDRKYPNGSRPNRVAGSGYWKATGTDKMITTEGRKVGIKKALVFYVGKAPKGIKTNWIMHEYRLLENSGKNGSAKLDDWVLCRIYKKNSGGQKPIMSSVPTNEHSHNCSTSSSSQHDDVIDSLPEIDDRFFTLPPMNSLEATQNEEKLNLQKLGSGNFDWASLARLTSLPELVPNAQFQAQAQPPVNNAIDRNVDSACEKFGSFLNDEFQSGLRTHRVDSGLFHHNSTTFSQSLANSVDPFCIRYPTHSAGFRFP